MKKQIIELVDDITHYVSVDELDKARILLETLKELLNKNL